MAIERIKLTPTNLTIKAVDSSVKFNSDYLYLKSDPSGTFNVGGYSRASMINGTVNNTALPVTDKLFAGGYPVLNLPVDNTTSGIPGPLIFNTPRFNTLNSHWTGSYKNLPGYVNVSNPLTVTLNGSVIGTVRWEYIFQFRFINGVPQPAYSAAAFIADKGQSGVYPVGPNSQIILNSSSTFPSGTISISGPTMFTRIDLTTGLLTTITSSANGYFVTNESQNILYTLETPTTLSLTVTP